jgi:putative membrane protein
MFYMHDIGWGWWLLMSVGMVAFWALVVYGFVWLVRGAPPLRREEAPLAPPDEILKRRLARGEITIEEYERLRGTIEETPRHPVAV